MSKKQKQILIATVATLVVVAVVGALLLTSNKPTSPTTTIVNQGGASNGGTSTASAGSSTTSTGQGSTGTQGGSGGSTTGGSNAAGTAKTDPTALTPLTPYPRLPTSKLAAVTLTEPEAPGKTLAPLKSAPDPTISALKVGLLPDGSRYIITMRPYGIGPDHVLGSRLVIRVDSAKPWAASTPAYGEMANANMLVVLDTTHKGTVTKGGTYTAYVTFRSDGTKLIPILSNVAAK